MPAESSPQPPTSDPLAFNRIQSIDIFRGLTMMLMIFVNDLSSVHGLPRWTYHAHPNEDYMTYVDMVFPAFLFIVGMALPLAMESRMRKDPSLLHLIGHIIERTLALFLLGLILANVDLGNQAEMHGLNPNLWGVLSLLGAGLFYAVYPRNSTRTGLFRAMRFGGLLLLIAMAVLFRRVTRHGDIAWISFAYGEILGLIGSTYLAVSMLYLATRRWTWAPLAWFCLLLAFCCAVAAKWILFPMHVSLWAWPLGDGSMATIAMAGVLLATLLFGSHRAQPHSALSRHVIALAFATFALLAGYLLVPLGISKVRGTPTWALWSIGPSVLLATLLHWLCDLRQKTAWAAFVRSAGTNTLLTYLLPDTLYFAIAATGTLWLRQHLSFGWPGVARACLFTGLMLLLSTGLTRVRIRLQL